MSADDPSSRFSEEVKTILGESFDLLLEKKADYEDIDHPMRTLRLSSELGIEPWKGALLRLGDKLSLAYNFARYGRHLHHSEPFRETILDLIAYAATAAVLFEMREELRELTVDQMMQTLRLKSGGRCGQRK